MEAVLGLTFELSQALQKKKQDIVNAIELIRIGKHRLQEMKTNEWDSFLDEVFSFCIKLEIRCMSDLYPKGDHVVIVKKSQIGIIIGLSCFIQL